MNSSASHLLRAATWIVIATPALSQETAQPVPAWQTAAGGKMAFEVASVKRAQPGAAFAPPSFPLDAGDSFVSFGDGSGQPPRGRFRASFPLVAYISFAYKLTLTPEQRQAMLAHLPNWVGTDRFDIEARAEGNPSKDQMRLMIQSLLADRFKLAAHFETQDVPLLALTLVKPGKTGPKLRPHAGGPPCDAPSTEVFPEACDVYIMTSKPDRSVLSGSRNTTMAALAASLPGQANAAAGLSPGGLPSGEGRLDRPVVDQTGLTGKFDFTLQWTPDSNATDTPGPTFLEALRDQLGLKLNSTKGPIQTLIVDHVESPSEN
jgi:bla regulator protein BlaR1